MDSQAFPYNLSGPTETAIQFLIVFIQDQALDGITGRLGIEVVTEENND
jgi:hypothetical protein